VKGEKKSTWQTSFVGKRISDTKKRGKIKNMASASFDSTKKATTTRFRILVHVKKHITIHKQPRKKRNKVFAFLFLPAGVSNIREKHHHSGKEGRTN
jgi:hypothetical protein